MGNSVSLPEEARRLRAEEELSARQIQQRLGVTKNQLSEWLRGVEPPGWTRRPNAKDGLRERAVALRGDGWSVTDLAIELGVAKSTAWRWVKHLPLDQDSERAQRKRAHSKLMTDGQWARWRVERGVRQKAIEDAAASGVVALTDRELGLLGAAIYWCEGAKAKPWGPPYKYLIFTNSDPMLIELFIRFVESVGVKREELTYRVAIHETADAGAAAVWWAARVGVPAEVFQRPTIKRHTPRTTRHNTGDHYHGCLVVRVRRSRELYWRVEGVMRGIADALGITRPGMVMENNDT